MAKNEKARDQIRIVAICGSLRPGSYTRMALQVALRGTHEIGAEVTLIDLRGYQLIFCDGKENESGYPNDVFRLRDEVKSALKFGVCRDTVRRNLPQLHKCRLFGFS